MFYSSQSGGNKTTKFITTRLGSVLDPNCFVVQLFNRQIANGGPVTITHPESVRYFMNTKEACQLILQLPWAMEGGLHIRYG
jgi:FlaA1/EpsC-like NDP-sugar epimerase